ncbi:MAG: tetratricopeptide repeat protein [Bacteroidetes bacterium]|nr:tetratricopeptide repeat protein [Bacteroidota bacterium]
MSHYINTILFILLFLIPLNIFPQDSTEIKDEEAVSLFVSGKSAELREDYKSAMEFYRTALKRDKSAGIYFAIANVNLRMGKLQDALIEINNALKLRPDNTEYKTMKANIYYGTGKVDLAVGLYEEILTAEPENIFVLYSLARSYQELKNQDRAVEVYEMLTDIYGFDTDVLKRMFDIYFSKQNFTKCAETLSYMLKLDPFNTNLLFDLATMYTKLDREDDARLIYERLAALNPSDKQTQAEIVKIYFRKNDIEKGFDEFAKLIGKKDLTFAEKIQLGELYFNTISQDQKNSDVVEFIFRHLNETNPDNWMPYYYLAQIDIQNKKNDEAAAKLLKGIVYADTTADAYMQIGYSLFTLEKYEQAKPVIEKGLALSPDDFRMNYSYALIMQRMGDMPLAIKYYEKAADLNPNELSILSSLALAYNSNKQYRESNEAYERALKIDPDNALILNNYAYNLSQRGENLNKALDMIKKAVNREPGNSSYLDTMGWIFFMMKDYKNAKEYLERAVSVNGSNAVILEHLGDAYNALKDAQKAVYFWKKALELNKSNKQLEEKIDFYNK